MPIAAGTLLILHGHAPARPRRWQRAQDRSTDRRAASVITTRRNAWTGPDPRHGSRARRHASVSQAPRSGCDSALLDVPVDCCPACGYPQQCRPPDDISLARSITSSTISRDKARSGTTPAGDARPRTSHGPAGHPGAADRNPMRGVEQGGRSRGAGAAPRSRPRVPQRALAGTRVAGIRFRP